MADSAKPHVVPRAPKPAAPTAPAPAAEPPKKTTEARPTCKLDKNELLGLVGNMRPATSDPDAEPEVEVTASSDAAPSTTKYAPVEKKIVRTVARRARTPISGMAALTIEPAPAPVAPKANSDDYVDLFAEGSDAKIDSAEAADAAGAVPVANAAADAFEDPFAELVAQQTPVPMLASAAADVSVVSVVEDAPVTVTVDAPPPMLAKPSRISEPVTAVVDDEIDLPGEMPAMDDVDDMDDFDDIDGPAEAQTVMRPSREMPAEAYRPDMPPPAKVEAEPAVIVSSAPAAPIVVAPLAPAREVSARAERPQSAPIVEPAARPSTSGHRTWMLIAAIIALVALIAIMVAI